MLDKPEKTYQLLAALKAAAPFEVELMPTVITSLKVSISRCSSAELGPVLETLEYVKHETDCWLEITTLLIPGRNDSPSEIQDLTNCVRERLDPDTPLHFSAFHPDWRMRDVTETPVSTLQIARDIALQNGLRYVYTGNVHDEARTEHLLPQL